MLWYKYKMLRVVFLFVMVFCAQQTHAELHINEIYPAPTGSDTEWVELYNDSSEAVLLDGYSLYDATNKKLIMSGSSVPGFGYILATSSNVLNNADETVTLAKLSGSVIESVTYGKGLDSSTSYVKCGSSWMVSHSISKLSANTAACVSLTPTETPPITPTVMQSPIPSPSDTTPSPGTTPSATPWPTGTSTVTPTPSESPQDEETDPQDATGVVFSEVYPYPGTGEGEWIELYNNTADAITLNNWYVDDTAASGSSPHKFNATISAHGYAVVDLSSAVFNNGGDTVRLLNSNQQEQWSITYTSAKKQLSWAVSGGSLCLQSPTKGSANGACTSDNSDNDTSTSGTSSSSKSSGTASAKTAAAAKTSSAASSKSGSSANGSATAKVKPLLYQSNPNQSPAALGASDGSPFPRQPHLFTIEVERPQPSVAVNTFVPILLSIAIACGFVATGSLIFKVIKKEFNLTFSSSSFHAILR